MSTNAAFQTDADHRPITQLGLLTSDSQILSGNNTTVTTPIFTIVGSVQVNALYGVVTTTLGANNTAAYWRLNDATAQSNITVNTGTTLSGAKAGALIVKKDLASAALTLLDASQERVSEPTTLETLYFSPFIVLQKTGGVATNIEFIYSTTDTPTTGAITFYAGWVPLAPGSSLSAL